MANNEVSGIVLSVYIAKFIKSLKNNYYSYRIIFVPETIGSIAYLHKNYFHLKKNIIAGFNITCVGDEGNFSYLESRYGNTFSHGEYKLTADGSVKLVEVSPRSGGGGIASIIIPHLTGINPIEVNI